MKKMVGKRLATIDNAATVEFAGVRAETAREIASGARYDWLYTMAVGLLEKDAGELANAFKSEPMAFMDFGKSVREAIEWHKATLEVLNAVDVRLICAGARVVNDKAA